jgi:uncharacterized protein YqjF (DUF2071 family)
MGKPAQGSLAVDAHVLEAVDLLVAPFAQTRVTRVRRHRPWPMPASPWVMAQTWIDLLFAHWELDPLQLSPFVPAPLELDTFGGRAWLGITPFLVRNLRLRLTLPIPRISAFPEINVRTYVTYRGKPGIWFFSLDADSRLAVASARRIYRLPYFLSRAGLARDTAAKTTVVYEGRRIDGSAPATARFRARYEPAGEPAPAAQGTLEHWLTERYCLYTMDDGGRPLRGEIHHPPWPLQPARAEVDVNTMTAELGLRLGDEPLLHFARRQDVVFWPLRPATR